MESNNYKTVTEPKWNRTTTKQTNVTEPKQNRATGQQTNDTEHKQNRTTTRKIWFTLLNWQMTHDRL